MDRRLWLRLALSAVLVAGFGVSVVLTQHHENRVYGDASVVLANCPETETVNCDTVNTSEWSELFVIPIAAFRTAQLFTQAPQMDGAHHLTRWAASADGSDWAEDDAEAAR